VLSVHPGTVRTGMSEKALGGVEVAFDDGECD
jgi:hypothetical protein